MEVKQIQQLSKMAAAAALLQFILICAFSAATVLTGPRPETAELAFKAFEQGKIFGLIKDEILIITMMSLYLVTFSALFYLLKERHYPITLLAVLFTFTAVILSIASQSAFSLMHLSERYFAAATPQEQSQILAAGEAVIAGNMWNGTSSYFAGFLLQGGGVMISIAMIGSKKFRMITIITGIASNGLDFIQHGIHHALPEPAKIILMAAGPFYFVWYFMLAWDLLKIGNSDINAPKIVSKPVSEQLESV